MTMKDLAPPEAGPVLRTLYGAARAALRARSVADLCREVCEAAVAAGGAVYASIVLDGGVSAQAGLPDEAGRSERFPLLCDGCACGEMALAPRGGVDLAGLASLPEDVSAALTGLDRRRRSEEARDNLRRMAEQDGLTGLLNRTAFRESVRVAALTGAEFAVLFVDLDGFKSVNDRLGHVVGDRVLTELARRLRAALRTGDLVARYGGDEFVALLPGIGDPDAAAGVCRALIARLSAPLPVECAEARVTASIGVALSPRDGTDPDALIEAADTAMYGVKREGKDAFRVHSVPAAESAGPA